MSPLPLLSPQKCRTHPAACSWPITPQLLVGASKSCPELLRGALEQLNVGWSQADGLEKQCPSLSSTASGKDPAYQPEHTLSWRSTAWFSAFFQFPFKSVRTRRRESPGIPPSKARALHPPPCLLNSDLGSSWSFQRCHGQQSIRASPRSGSKIWITHSRFRKHVLVGSLRLFRQRIWCLTIQTSLESQNHKIIRVGKDLLRAPTINPAVPSPPPSHAEHYTWLSRASPSVT